MMQLIKDNFHMRIFCPSGSVILVTPQEDWTREDDGWAELIGRCAFYLSTGLTDLIKGLSRSLGKEFAGAELDAVLGPICSNLNVWQYSDLIHKQTPLTLLWPVRSTRNWLPFQIDRVCSCLSHARNDFYVVMPESLHVCATAVLSVLCTTGHLEHQHGSVRIRDGCR